MTAREHYDNHLAHFYSWMLGEFEEKQNIQLDYFNRNNIKPGIGNIAIDLGAGNPELLGAEHLFGKAWLYGSCC